MVSLLRGPLRSIPVFAVFLILVAVYVALLLWCLAPPFIRDKMRPRDWLRFSVGAALLAANISPLFAFPVAMPLAFAGTEVSQRLVAVMLFVRTTPRYIANMINRSNAAATVVEVTYTIEIAGVRYMPVVRTACTTRKTVDVDKGVEIHTFNNIPTASGGEFFAQAGDGAIALNQSDICKMIRAFRLKDGAPPDFKARSGIGQRVYVIRGKADDTKRYELQFHDDVVRIDDVVLHEPRITEIEIRPATEVISSDDLWPMRRSGERSLQDPDVIEAIRRLPGGENACIEYITATIDFRTQSPKELRTRMTSLRHVPVEQRADYCRNVLSRLPMPRERLSPTSS